jgi:UDP-glucose 4-epimerase
MYFVTGGTGFFGCYVVRELLRQERPVTIFDLHPDLELLDLVAGPNASQRATVVRGDASQAVQLLGAVRQAAPEVVLHLASPLTPETERDATHALQQMTQAHINVLEAARLFGLRRVVYASATSSIFGRAEQHGGLDVAVPNDAPHYPVSLYGICKSTNERLARLYWERFGIDSVGLRFCQGYGPGKRRGGQPFTQDMFDKGLHGEPCRIPHGDDLVNWQYVEEIATIIVQAGLVGRLDTRVFNTTGHVVPVRSAIDVLSSMRPQASFQLEPGTTGLVWRFDTSLLEKELGFRWRVTIEEGFRKTIDTLHAWRTAGVW